MTCLFCSLIRRILIFSYANNHIYTPHTIHTLFRVQSTHLTLSSESFILFFWYTRHLPFFEFQYYWNFPLFSRYNIERCENFPPPCSLRAGLVYTIKISSRFFFPSKSKWKMATLRVKKIITEFWVRFEWDDFVNCLRELSGGSRGRSRINWKNI
jgi:hypothetical protein